MDQNFMTCESNIMLTNKLVEITIIMLFIHVPGYIHTSNILRSDVAIFVILKSGQISLVIFPTFKPYILNHVILLKMWNLSLYKDSHCFYGHMNRLHSVAPGIILPNWLKPKPEKRMRVTSYSWIFKQFNIVPTCDVSQPWLYVTVHRHNKVDSSWNHYIYQQK